tara:strand:- start:1205 stop:1447 length:243 start_codon:yes stop_codon:yes gene_type:complete
MPYLTNNQRMDLGLEGACCVKPETLHKADTSKVYVDEEEQEKLLGKTVVTPVPTPEPVVTPPLNLDIGISEPKTEVETEG